MSFFKEVDIAIQDKAPDERTAQVWKELASRHFTNSLITPFDSLPEGLQAVIKEVEGWYTQAMEEINAHTESEV